MAPIQYQQALRARGFVMEGSGRWHGPFGLTVPNTWNTITTTSLADSAREEVIRSIDAQIAVERNNANAK